LTGRQAGAVSRIVGVTDARWPALLEQAWSAVAGETAVPGELRVEGPPAGELPSTLPVADAALACTAAALLAAAALGARRSGGRRVVSLRAEHVAAAVRSEAYLRVGGEPLGPGFAPLSRFWRAADGWVRTHANYPWHRRALLAALGFAPELASESSADTVASAIAELPATEVEDRVVAAGGVAAALRRPDQWLAHPHGTVVAEQPLVATTHHPGAPSRRRAPDDGARTGGARTGGARTSDRELPAAGIRVLDLTRVIAGPVATRYLAALGADVLRLDPPDRPELPLHRYDGLVGKRSALLDAATPDGLRRLHELLAGADVLVHGYRPGALARFGLDGAGLARRHPGLVVVAMSAWGSRGPWGGRRGFDSIVQSAVGIAARESPDGDRPDARPGALPCQLLDHGTGYLCAAAALDGLRRQAEVGGTWVRELSLARTAHWLLGEPATERRPAVPASDITWLTEVPSTDGPVTTVAPPGSLDGTPLRWPELPLRYGTDAARW
jgi:crotonobetainyl-CoA:carnitine CoA-transferase CaiB-like acyl-CoA transferase